MIHLQNQAGRAVLLRRRRYIEFGRYGFKALRRHNSAALPAKVT